MLNMSFGGLIMFEDDFDIEKLTSKLADVSDDELRDLVNRLIVERDMLLDIVDIDYLTGVYNRRILDKISDFSVVALCNVHVVNDLNRMFGRDVGDRLLQKIADILKNNIRGADYLCRYDSTEFLLIFCGCNKKTVEQRMLDIRNLILSAIVYPDVDNILSIGISDDNNGMGLKYSIQQASDALYNSQNIGKKGDLVYRKTK